MNRNDIINQVLGITDESQLRFFEGGERIMNRFDVKPKKEPSVDAPMKAAFFLYAYISKLIILKANGKEESMKGKLAFTVYFNKVMTAVPEDIRNSLADETEKLSHVVDDFLLDRVKVSFAELLSALAPIVFVQISLSDDQGIDRKVFKELSRSRETIFNLSVLYVRSLFRTYLTVDGIDPSGFRYDAANPGNPVLVYQNTLIVPTGRNAFSLAGFKDVIDRNTRDFSKDFSLKDIDAVEVLYLTKAILVHVSLTR